MPRKRVPRRRVNGYKRRKPGGKYRTVTVKSYLRKRGRTVKKDVEEEEASKSPSPSTNAIRKAVPYIAGGR